MCVCVYLYMHTYKKCLLCVQVAVIATSLSSPVWKIQREDDLLLLQIIPLSLSWKTQKNSWEKYFLLHRGKDFTKKRETSTSLQEDPCGKGSKGKKKKTEESSIALKEDDGKERLDLFLLSHKVCSKLTFCSLVRTGEGEICCIRSYVT